ncbi:MAG: VWA domain-containing protein [Lachnospiraceae bacterium]|nr:VWA domain-containing protein [Lachnospiraceae bacterium]
MKRLEKMTARFMMLVLGLFLFIPERSFAAENEQLTEKKQIIFLLDASKSMQGDGQWIEAADSACMIAAALPEEYEVALLVYNTEIVYQEDFGNINQKTRHALETIELQGYTTPAAALDRAGELFVSDAAEKRVVFISDGEISMRGEQETEEAVRQFEKEVDRASEQNIKIDMFVIPNENTENQVSYGTSVTSGEVYTVGDNQTIEEITAKYLFQTLQIEKTELGEAVSDKGNMEVDLQDIYMQNAKLLLISGDVVISDFHVAGQCERLNMVQGNKFAVAELENPLERQIMMDYSLESRGNVRIYLIKEYFLQANAENSYTSEDGSFDLKVNVMNHQDKPVLDSDVLKRSTSIFINGEETDYDVEHGIAVVPYQTDKTAGINMEVDICFNGNVIHYIKNQETIELTVPIVEEEPDYTILWIVIASLLAAIFLLSVLYQRKKQKKKSGGEPGAVIIEQADTPIMPKYDFSGQLSVYLLKGECEDDIPPCSIKLFGRSRKNMTFDWIKDCCGIGYKLADADKIKFTGGKDHALCFKNNGCATIVKENQILNRERKYSMYYGEKILLIFNDGGTEIELHYKNMKPSER